MSDKQQVLTEPWREIILSDGSIALVDEADFEKVSERKWHRHWARGKAYKYASCNISKREALKYGVKVRGPIPDRDANGRVPQTRCTLHQFLMGRRPGFVIDHANRDALDCRRSNLRWATQSGNGANRKKRSRTTSIYRGVCWLTKHNRWYAQIRVNGRHRSLGRYVSEVAAAQAYDYAAKAAFGEFANLNFPESSAA